MAETQQQATPGKSRNIGALLQIVFAVLNLGVMGGGAYPGVCLDNRLGKS